jgi:hypothetical protein
MWQTQPLIPVEKRVVEAVRNFWSHFRDFCIRFHYFVYTSAAYTPPAPPGSSLRPVSSEDAGESGSVMTVSQVRDSMETEVASVRALK